MKKALLTTFVLFIISQIKLNAQVLNSESDVIKYMDGKAFYNDQKGLTIGYGEIGSLNTYGIIVVANNGNKFYYINCNIAALGNSATIYGMDPNNGNNFGFKLKNRELIVGDDYNGKVIFDQDPSKTDKFGLSLKRKESTSQSNNYNSKSEKITGVASTPVKDFDGNTYKTIKIGSQIWMAENLQTTKYNDGSNISLVINDGEWARNISNKMPMMFISSHNASAMYNWYVINLATNGNKNVCPVGWHVPTMKEWDALISFLGGTNQAFGKLASNLTQNWRKYNSSVTNSSGFSGFPSGYRDPKNGVVYYGKEDFAWWWTSTENNSGDAWLFTLSDSFGGGSASSISFNKNLGNPVRCIKD